MDFISITEQIDTSSPMGKAMFILISAIAEFERSLISERVRAGIANQFGVFHQTVANYAPQRR